MTRGGRAGGRRRPRGRRGAHAAARGLARITSEMGVSPSPESPRTPWTTRCEPSITSPSARATSRTTSEGAATQTRSQREGHGAEVLRELHAQRGGLVGPPRGASAAARRRRCAARRRRGRRPNGRRPPRPPRRSSARSLRGVVAQAAHGEAVLVVQQQVGVAEHVAALGGAQHGVAVVAAPGAHGLVDELRRSRRGSPVPSTISPRSSSAAARSTRSCHAALELVVREKDLVAVAQQGEEVLAGVGVAELAEGGAATRCVARATVCCA
jgi:hypothetical protein